MRGLGFLIGPFYIEKFFKQFYGGGFMVGSTAGKVLCLAHSDSGCPGVSPELDPLTTVVQPHIPPKNT